MEPEVVGHCLVVGQGEEWGRERPGRWGEVRLARRPAEASRPAPPAIRRDDIRGNRGRDVRKVGLKGLALLRLGHTKSACEVLGMASDDPRATEYVKAMPRVALALALHQNGDLEAARRE